MSRYDLRKKDAAAAEHAKETEAIFSNLEDPDYNPSLRHVLDYARNTQKHIISIRQVRQYTSQIHSD